MQASMLTPAERQKIRQKVWREKNIDRIRVREKEYRAKNVAAIKANALARMSHTKAYMRNYYAANHATILAKKRVYRVANRPALLAKMKSDGTAAAVDIDEFKATLNGGVCAASGCAVNWRFCEVDHLRPDLKGDKLSHCSRASLKKEIKQNTDEHGVVQLQLLCPVHHRIKSGYTEREPQNDRERVFRQWRLENGGCEMCTASVYTLPLFCFDADHISPLTKVGGLGRITHDKGFTVDDVHIELGKCRMLCATCHRIHTQIQSETRHAAFASSVVHGASIK